MMDLLRNLVTRDLGLKLTALALAVLIWSTVRVAGPQTTRTFHDLPVRVVSASTSVRDFRLEPAVAEVTVRGDKTTVDRLTARLIHVIADVTGMNATGRVRQRIEVTLPPGVTFVRATPSDVDVVCPPPQ